ncbi:MAG: low molecular weight phosphotyrosine protein phosphatase [Actinomycetia bacterium]|nr:low molecular weight phosphotyrosine protein phosphatase [Actinomycetes bacterium]
MRILFVCHGNTCRSPTAAAVTTHLLAHAGLAGIEVASAGLAPRAGGDPPNELAVAVGEQRGYSIDSAAQLLTPDELAQADLVIAMDHENAAGLEALAGGPQPQHRLFLDFDPASEPGTPIPDPWGHGPEAYATMFDAVERAATALVEHLASLDRN